MHLTDQQIVLLRIIEPIQFFDSDIENEDIRHIQAQLSDIFREFVRRSDEMKRPKIYPTEHPVDMNLEKTQSFIDLKQDIDIFLESVIATNIPEKIISGLIYCLRFYNLPIQHKHLIIYWDNRMSPIVTSDINNLRGMIDRWCQNKILVDYY